MSITSRILVPVLTAAAGAALYVMVQRWGRRAFSPSSASPGFSPNERLRLATLEALPDRNSVLEPPMPLWDAILGGRKGEYLGAPSWGYFSVYSGTNPDGTKRKGGTTCEIFVAYCMAKAGWPLDFINRAKDDPVAPGAGFNAGMHAVKIKAAAQQRGWIVTPPHGVAGPDTPLMIAGDAYCTTRPGATYDGKPVSGEHMGIVLDVSEPNAAGQRTVVTADGGQTNVKGEQCAHWNTRTLFPDGRLVANGVESKLEWVVRAPAGAA